MNKIIVITLVILLTSIVSFAQSLNDSVPQTYRSQIDSLLVTIANDVQKISEQFYAKTPLSGRYKMYQTENIYNLLKLDTATGRIEQVQWSLKESEEMIVTINSSDLSHFGEIGTFELYPTKNMYQFILLDTTDGRTWHVQWGTESKKRWIQRIY